MSTSNSIGSFTLLAHIVQTSFKEAFTTARIQVAETIQPASSIPENTL